MTVDGNYICPCQGYEEMKYVNDHNARRHVYLERRQRCPMLLEFKSCDLNGGQA
jgi:hypothetical protein